MTSGIAATLVMGLGTALTVAVIAVLAVSAKAVARRLGAGREGGVEALRFFTETKNVCIDLGS